MSSYEHVEEVQPAPQCGNSGPYGWGFTLRGDPNCGEDVHRKLLEAFADAHPAAELRLPPWGKGEDLIEGWLRWEGAEVWVWIENILNYIWLWSADRGAVDRLRDALLPFAKAM